MSDQKLAEFRKNFSELRLLIIDEMSLLGADMLYNIHVRLCEIKQTKKTVPFGGIGVILVGDLMQLPPVNERYIFKIPRNPHLAAFSDVVNLWKQFEPYVLQHNHRQGESRDWAATLNRIRDGTFTNDDELVLKSRVSEEPFLNEDAMHVFYMNKDVHEHNAKMLRKLETVEQIFPAVHVLPKGCSPFVNKHGIVGSTQFQQDLRLKTGARCMLVFNVNTIDELVNGATGTVIAFERAKRFVKSEQDCIIVKFDSDKCGEMQRKRYPVQSQKHQHQNGTPIFRTELEYFMTSRRGKSHSARAKVVQFPLRLSYASTSHKMQVRLNHTYPFKFLY